MAKQTEQEKEEKRQQKIKQLELKLKQLKATEKKQEKRQRTRELIEIGAYLSQFHDRAELLAYFRDKPRFRTISDDDPTKIVISDTWDKSKPTTVFISPLTAQKKKDT